VVFDRVQENTRGLASSNRLTYTDTVNLSMNQVLARSLNTSLVAILPILSILVIGAWILGATALNDFGLALFVGLTTGAYSSIFIASPVLALMKEREPRYAEIRRRLVQARPRRLTPAAVAGTDLSTTTALGGTDDDIAGAWAEAEGAPTRTARRQAEQLPEEVEYGGSGDGGDRSRDSGATPGIPLRTDIPPRSGNRPPPRPRKKGRRR
jgi:hypothetical protein